MKEMPTSGPMTSSISHQDRDTTSSRRSLSTSHPQGPRLRAPRFGTAGLCEGKEDLFEIVAGIRSPRGGERRELRQRAFAADASAAQQHETVADPRRVGDLMDREQQRTAVRGMRAQRRGGFARLPQIEAIERLGGKQNRLRGEEAQREQAPVAPGV